MDKVKMLSINGGSSSIKFALYGKARELNLIFSGFIKRIGEPGCEISVKDGDNRLLVQKPLNAGNINEAAELLLSWMEGTDFAENLKAIGHRIVHGLSHTHAERIDGELLKQLQKNIFFDPDHLPGEIALIDVFTRKYPQLPQVACFDTSFHTTIPPVASILPIPRKFAKYDLHRYGFHGISCSYLMEVLGREYDIKMSDRIILAHLGNGASLTAVKNKKSVDTSMGFSPAGGFPMSTRSGDLDPGILTFIMKKDHLTTEQVNDLVNHESGLIGISETSADIQDLLKLEKVDNRAAEAIEIFCYQVKKWIGSFTAALGGIDILVFSGGIGENAFSIRERICEGLQFLGIELDHELNKKSDRIISGVNSRVLIYAIPTNEELMIAKSVCQILTL